MYNSMSMLPYIPYNVLKFLAQNDDIIWKLLKYNDYDALSKPDLTFSEKMDLIWKTGKQDNKSVFLTNLVEDNIAESRSIFKIYQYYIHAKQLFSSTVVYAFDFLYGGQSTLVEYNGIPVSRGDLFVNRVLSVLNGAHIGGIGDMVFYDGKSRYSLERAVIGNSKTFTGVCLYLAVDVGDEGSKEEGCEA